MQVLICPGHFVRYQVDGVSRAKAGLGKRSGLFHDCGHGSFFKSRRANDIVGFITGMLTFTPYYHCRWRQAIHHSNWMNVALFSAAAAISCKFDLTTYLLLHLTVEMVVGAVGIWMENDTTLTTTYMLMAVVRIPYTM